MSITYIIDWIIVTFLTLMLVLYVLGYRRMKTHAAKGWIGLIAIGVLVLAAFVGVAQTHAHAINLATGLSPVLILDVFAIQAVAQWALVNVQTRQQRTARLVITGFVVFYALVVLVFFAFRL